MGHYSLCVNVYIWNTNVQFQSKTFESQSSFCLSLVYPNLKSVKTCLCSKSLSLYTLVHTYVSLQMSGNLNAFWSYFIFLIFLLFCLIYNILCLLSYMYLYSYLFAKFNTVCMFFYQITFLLVDLVMCSSKYCTFLNEIYMYKTKTIM